MPKYEVTGYIQIPTTTVVEASTIEEALDLGRETLDWGLGYQHDQYMSDNYFVTTENGEPLAQYVDGELMIEKEESNV
jgi:hypothetical protein